MRAHLQVDLIDILEEGLDGVFILPIMKEQEFDMRSRHISRDPQLIEVVNLSQEHGCCRPDLLIYCIKCCMKHKLMEILRTVLRIIEAPKSFGYPCMLPAVS